MSNKYSRTWIVGGVSIAAVAVVTASSAAAGADLATSTLWLVMCAVPIGVALLIGIGPSQSTVAEVLYAVNTPKEGRP
jgi:hypothetical protein